MLVRQSQSISIYSQKIKNDVDLENRDIFSICPQKDKKYSEHNKSSNIVYLTVSIHLEFASNCDINFYICRVLSRPNPIENLYSMVPALKFLYKLIKIPQILVDICIISMILSALS